MFNLTLQSIIYITAPPCYASGGPELLHQLCHTLRKLGFNCMMYYFDESNPSNINKSPTPNRFLHYNTSYVTEINDCIENLLIVPETITSPLKSYANIQKCVWWLGANNYFWFKEISNSNYILPTMHHWIEYILGYHTPLTFRQMNKYSSYNLGQCWYTVSFLQHKGLHNVAYLSDYINEDFILFSQNTSHTNKNNIILYNPSRNKRFVRLLKKNAPLLQFVPIQNMTPEEVRDLMSSAKLYIDFGAHPGKDRMPREAALCGCCIMTSTLGSADFYDDVPIPSEFKFERKFKNVNAILRKIYDVLDNFENERSKFDNYRNIIKQEQAHFLIDVKKLFQCTGGYDQ